MARARIVILLFASLIGIASPAAAEESRHSVIAEFQAAFDEARAQQDHESLAAIANQLATAHSRDGDFGAAETALVTTIQSIDQSPENPPSGFADVLIQLGDIHHGNGNYATAADAYQRAVVTSERSFGPQHISVATAVDRRARLHVTLSEFVEAETLFARAARIRERTLGADHPDTALGHDNLARLNVARNNFVAAEANYRQALMIRRAHWGDVHKEVADSLENLAELAFANGDADASIAYAEQALAIRIDLLGINAPDVLRTRQDLAALREAVRRLNQPSIGAAGPEPVAQPLPDGSAVSTDVTASPPNDDVLTDVTPVESVPKPVDVVAAPPVASPATPETPAAYMVQLGSFRSEDTANTEWRRLRETFAEHIGARDPLIAQADLGERGTFFRIRTGPFTAQRAAAACDSLAQHNQPCLVIAP